MRPKEVRAPFSRLPRAVRNHKGLGWSKEFRHVTVLMQKVSFCRDGRAFVPNVTRNSWHTKEDRQNRGTANQNATVASRWDVIVTQGSTKWQDVQRYQRQLRAGEGIGWSHLCRGGQGMCFLSETVPLLGFLHGIDYKLEKNVRMYILYLDE